VERIFGLLNKKIDTARNAQFDPTLNIKAQIDSMSKAMLKDFIRNGCGIHDGRHADGISFLGLDISELRACALRVAPRFQQGQKRADEEEEVELGRAEEGELVDSCEELEEMEMERAEAEALSRTPTMPTHVRERYPSAFKSLASNSNETNKRGVPLPSANSPERMNRSTYKAKFNGAML
jgi:hypothetical protein